MRVGARLRDKIEGWNLHERLRLGIVGQQGLDLTTQIRVAVTSFRKERRALFSRAVPRGLEEGLNLMLSLDAHCGSL
jgi:hypothetical protein